MSIFKDVKRFSNYSPCRWKLVKIIKIRQELNFLGSKFSLISLSWHYLHLTTSNTNWGVDILYLASLCNACIIVYWEQRQWSSPVGTTPSLCCWVGGLRLWNRIYVQCPSAPAQYTIPPEHNHICRRLFILCPHIYDDEWPLRASLL